MSTVPRQKRGVCAVCGTSCRVVPTEILWLERSTRSFEWLWSSKHLCGTCQLAERELWLPTSLAKRRHDRTLPTLSPRDVADLETLRTFKARPTTGTVRRSSALVDQVVSQLQRGRPSSPPRRGGRA